MLQMLHDLERITVFRVGLAQVLWQFACNSMHKGWGKKLKKLFNFIDFRTARCCFLDWGYLQETKNKQINCLNNMFPKDYSI